MSVCTEIRPIDRANQRRLNAAMVGWAFVFLLSTAFAANGTYGTAVEVAATLAPIAAGVPVVLLFSRYLREADELTRLIELKAIAIAAGAVFLMLPAAQVAQGALGMNTFIDVPLVTLAATYSSAAVWLRRRYQ